MYHFKQLILTAVCLLFSAVYSYADADRKVIIISSYSPDYQWSNIIIDGINESIKASAPETQLHIEYISSERFPDPMNWVERTHFVVDNCEKDSTISAIIIISDEAWMAYRSVNSKKLSHIPLFLCAVKPHTIDIERYVAHNTELTIDDFIPTTEAMKQLTPNATGVIRQMNIPKYLELISDVIPDLSSYKLITDNRFYGIYTRLLVEQYIKQNNIQTPIEYFDSRFMNTDSLLKKLPEFAQNDGVLMTSWLTGQAGFEYSRAYVYKKMVSTLKSPIFITNDIGLSSGNFMGGYFYNSAFWGSHVGDMVIKSLLGTPTCDIAIEVVAEDQCNINFEVLSRFQISPKVLPHDTKFINRPESIFKKYSKSIAAIAIGLSLILLWFGYVLHNNRRLKRAQLLAQQATDHTISVNQELIKTKEALEVALEKAEAADRMKSAFISNMDHEIRTPLNSIIGFSNLIATMDDKKEIEEAAGYITENSDKLLNLIKSILDLSQIESGTIYLTYSRINLSDVFVDLTNLGLGKAHQGVTLKFNPPQRPITITTDLHRMSQALYNLMDNALKFTQSGTVELGYFAVDDSHVECYVQDTGVGIKPEDMAFIFDRFYKCDQYVMGSGLGLSIAKKIVLLLDGEFGATSEFGVGSRFWFRLKINNTTK